MVQLSKLFSDFKKRLSSVFSYNKKTLILGITLGLFLCVFSFQVAEAKSIVDWFKDIYNYIITLPIRMPFLFLAIIIAVLNLASQTLFLAVGSLLNWLIGTTLSIPVISGWVVEVGFEFTKNFANMLIVFILAFIGLATILRIKEYEARKILPKLIMVALLINFTPVMVGFIVDIADLFTNFFFDKIRDALTSINVASSTLKDLGDVAGVEMKISTIGSVIEDSLVPILIKGVVMILFYNFAAFVYFLVFLLFLFRLIILWVLVILAPIAFFSQVLPEGPTVKALFPNILHWNKWWETLIQWAFIGVPLGFFLYLSAWIINQTGTPLLSSWETISGLSTDFNDIIGAILAPVIGLIILIVGMIISTESMPGIAKRIYGGAKGAGRRITKGVKQRTLGRLALTERGKELTEKAAKYQGFSPKLGKWKDAKGGWAKARWLGKGALKAAMAPTAFPIKHAIRSAGRRGQAFRAEIPGLIDQEMKDKKLQNLVKKKDWEGLATQYKVPLATSERKTAVATLLAKHKGKKGLGELDKLEPGLSEEATKLAMKHSPSHAQTIIAANPHLAKSREVWTKTIDPTDKRTKADMEKVRKRLEEKGEITKGRDLEGIIAAGDKDKDYIKIAERLSSKNTVKGLSLPKIEDLTYETFDDPDFQEDFVLTKGVKFIVKVDEVIGPEITEKLRAKIKDVGAEALAEENPTLLRSYFTSPSRDVLGASLEHPDTKKRFDDIHDVNKYIDKVKKQVSEAEIGKMPTIPINILISNDEINAKTRQIQERKGEVEDEETTALMQKRLLASEGLIEGTPKANAMIRKLNALRDEKKRQARQQATQILIKQNQELMSDPKLLPEIIKKGTQEQRQDMKLTITEGKDFIKKINKDIKELQTLSQKVRSAKTEGLTETQENALDTQRERIQNLKTEILTNKRGLNTTINEIRGLNEEIGREAAARAQEERE